MGGCLLIYQPAPGLKFVRRIMFGSIARTVSQLELLWKESIAMPVTELKLFSTLLFLYIVYKIRKDNLVQLQKHWDRQLDSNYRDKGYKPGEL